MLNELERFDAVSFLRRKMLSASLTAACSLLLSASAGAATTAAAPAGAVASAGQDSMPQSTPYEDAGSLAELLFAAASGNADAMNVLGLLYTFGDQLPRDYELALYWYQQAVDSGSANAMNNLANMYLHGLGVPRDYPNAARWFRRSAEAGNVCAMYSAGVMAEAGLGIARDAALAQSMYRQAAERGFAPAMVKLSDVSDKPSAPGADLVEAYAWLQVALRSGLPDELEIPVLSKIEALGARLGPDQRDQARVRAAILATRAETRGAGSCEDGADDADAASASVL